MDLAHNTAAERGVNKIKYDNKRRIIIIIIKLRIRYGNKVVMILTCGAQGGDNPSKPTHIFLRQNDDKDLRGQYPFSFEWLQIPIINNERMGEVKRKKEKKKEKKKEGHSKERKRRRRRRRKTS